MLPDPFENADIAPLAKALMETGRMTGRLQVYQEISTALGAMLKANEHGGASFDVIPELLNMISEGVVETGAMNQLSVQKVIEAARGQDDS